MRNALIILVGVVVGVALRYLLPPATTPAPPSTPEAHFAPIQETKPGINPAYVEPELYVRGYVVLGRRANVFLSDGTTWTEQFQGELKIFRHYVQFRGKTYPIKSDLRVSPAVSITPIPQSSRTASPSGPALTLTDTVGQDLLNASGK